MGEGKINLAKVKLDLYDTNVDEKTWKFFKKSASQEELLIIAIGAKYRVIRRRLISILYTIGMILSIALLFFTEFYSLIGYPIFAFLSTKIIRYGDTYSQSYRLLSKDNKAYLDSLFSSNIALGILDFINRFCIFWLTIPYQAILIMIGLIAPNFVISKNGILVSIPSGYDVGGLAAVGAYYEQFTLLDESMATMEKAAKEEYARKHKYQAEFYEDGSIVKVYSADDDIYYDDRNNKYKRDGQYFKKL